MAVFIYSKRVAAVKIPAPIHCDRLDRAREGDLWAPVLTRLDGWAWVRWGGWVRQDRARVQLHARPVLILITHWVINAKSYDWKKAGAGEFLQGCLVREWNKSALVYGVSMGSKPRLVTASGRARPDYDAVRVTYPGYEPDDLKSLHLWIIAEPPAAAVQQYLDMGWYRVQDKGQPCLRWSFAMGTPRFPGGEAEFRRRNEELALRQHRV